MTPGVTATYNWTQSPVIADIGIQLASALEASPASTRHPFSITAFETRVETPIALRVKKHIETTNPSADRISIPSSANPRAQFRNFANVAKTRNPDARQAT
jgi:hypothetical protein